MDSQQLIDLVNSDDSWVSRRARLAIEIVERHQMGLLKDDEFKELLEDLVRTDGINEQAASIETKTAFVTAIYAIAKVV